MCLMHRVARHLVTAWGAPQLGRLLNPTSADSYPLRISNADTLCFPMNRANLGRIRKPQVVGSNPMGGSILKHLRGKVFEAFVGAATTRRGPLYRGSRHAAASHSKHLVFKAFVDSPNVRSRRLSGSPGNRRRSSVDASNPRKTCFFRAQRVRLKGRRASLRCARFSCDS